MDKHWVTIVIVVLIIIIIVDGIRRMRKARGASIKMALKPVQSGKKEKLDDDDGYKSEFPNGGARPSKQKIDPSRIKQARAKFKFGEGAPAWGNKTTKEIAGHQTQSATTSHDETRIEPSLDTEADPLLDSPTDNPAIKTTSRFMETDANIEEELIEEETIEETHIDRLTTTKESPKTKSDTSEQESPEDTDWSFETPEQKNLNLEDSVPMLMDTLEENPLDETDAVPTSTSGRPETMVSPGTSFDETVKKEAQRIYSANKPCYESKYADHSQPAGSYEDILVIHVKAPKNKIFHGRDLLELILENGMRFGAMDIFHRHANDGGEGPTLFSMANMVKPGTFDLHSFETFSTVGLSFFLRLPAADGNHLEAFELMLVTAETIAEKLTGDLQDEQRNILTGQAIEHYRERIRDFARKERLKKNRNNNEPFR